MLLQIEKLYFSYPTTPANLFEDFSLQFYDGWTCLAGSNGCGKSTLLKLIAGSLLPDSGRIFTGATVSNNDIVYCPQETSQIPENIYSVFWSDDNEIRRFFSMLHVSEEMLERYDTLSGGEKKRIQIACALAEKPAILLLDEPTNHLDKSSREVVKKYLTQKKGFILVSHDRDLLDACIDHVLVLNRQSITVQSGNFSSWWENKKKADAFAQSENEKHLKEISQLKIAADRAARWADKNESSKIGYNPTVENDRFIDTRAYIGAKTKKMQSRVKNFEK